MDRQRRSQYLQAMGIVEWQRREPAAAPAVQQLPAAPATEPGLTDAPLPAGGEIAQLDWDELQARVLSCTACDLHKSRTQAVFGVGNRNADWMIVGEAPGAEEDRRGEPFVGRAGQLLDSMLHAIGLDRQQVYIANVLKCRPPNNRDPRPEEVEQCEPWLQRQVALVQPRLILAVGRVAAQNLLKTNAPLSRLRGRRHSYGEANTPLVVTYHPAYLLRSPLEKRKAWQDLKLALEVAGG